MDRIVVTRVTSLGADDLFAWWTDYDATDHAGPALGVPGLSMHRTLLRPTADEHARFRDTLRAPFWSGYYESAVWLRDGRSVFEASDGTFGRFDTVYAFETLPGAGCRVTMAIDALDPRVTRWGAFGRVVGRALAQRDLDGHVADAERALGAAAPAAQP